MYLSNTTTSPLRISGYIQYVVSGLDQQQDCFQGKTHLDSKVIPT